MRHSLACQSLSWVTLLDAQGWTTLAITFGSLEAARGHIPDFGWGEEVLKSPALRERMRDYAEQVADPGSLIYPNRPVLAVLEQRRLEIRLERGTQRIPAF